MAESVMPRKGWNRHHENSLQSVINDLTDEHMIAQDARAGMDLDQMALAVHHLELAISALRDAERG